MNKIISLNKDPEEFKVILSESKFIKSDAIDKEGNLYEIKKYSKTQLKKYRLYSEPIIKVAPSRSKWGSGDPFFDNFRSAVEYNNFIGDLMETKWWKQYHQIILDSIIYSNRGIYCKDGFLSHDKLKFRNFVLFPLKEISPNWIHPKTNENISALIEKLSDDERKSIYKVKNN